MYLFLSNIKGIDRFLCNSTKILTAMTFIEEYCMDQTGPLQHQGIQARTGACSWPVGEDGVDMPRPERDAFDAFVAFAWHSWRTFYAPFSTLFSDFETRF